MAAASRCSPSLVYLRTGVATYLSALFLSFSLACLTKWRISLSDFFSRNTIFSLSSAFALSPWFQRKGERLFSRIDYFFIFSCVS